MRLIGLLAAMFAGTMALTFSGCGPSYPPTYQVTGKVTVDGQPLQQGTITFYPTQGRSALGKIQPDGSYTLTTFNDDDGAVPGSHQVTIKATQVSGPAAPSSFEEELAQAQAGGVSQTATVTWLVPEKYSRRETTPLTAVVAEKATRIDFDITD